MMDAEKAVHALDVFTKNWCIDSYARQQGELRFRCDGCEFNALNSVCLVKEFKRRHYPQYKNFGSMGDF